MFRLLEDSSTSGIGAGTAGVASESSPSPSSTLVNAGIAAAATFGGDGLVDGFEDSMEVAIDEMIGSSEVVIL